jgi:hypothetical protein
LLILRDIEKILRNRLEYDKSGAGVPARFISSPDLDYDMGAEVYSEFGI